MAEFYSRRSVRFKVFDYRTHGAYFVTVVSHERACVFGEVESDRVLLSSLGTLVEQELLRTADLRPNVELDEFVIMPNHVHAILWLMNEESHEYAAGAFGKPKAGSLPTVVGLFKSEVTKAAKVALGIERVWQRGFYEHVIRNERSLHEIRRYIVDNPAAWTEDEENPANRH